MELVSLIQRALQGLSYLERDFVCSGVWCSATANSYKRFLIDEGVDPHFTTVQPTDKAQLPASLLDYIYKSEDSSEIVPAIVDLIDPTVTITVNIEELPDQPEKNVESADKSLIDKETVDEKSGGEHSSETNSGTE